MSKNLSILEDVKNEITYNSTGEGYISQRGVARLVGVGATTVRDHIKKQSAHLELNNNRQLHEGSLLVLLRSIGANNSQVLEIVNQIEVIGVRSVFHTTAQAVQRPMTQLESFKQMVKMEEERIVMVEKITSQSVVIDDDAILTNKSDEYYPISHVKKLNPKVKLSGIKLSRESEELGIAVKKLYSNYNNLDANTYHGTVWLAVYPEIVL